MTDSELIREYLEGRAYAEAQQFQRCGGSMDCDDFVRLLANGFLRTEIHLYAMGRSRTHEDYKRLWRHGWGGVAMAPPGSTEAAAWKYARAAMWKLYFCAILPARKKVENFNRVIRNRAPVVVR